MGDMELGHLEGCASVVEAVMCSVFLWLAKGLGRESQEKCSLLLSER